MSVAGAEERESSAGEGQKSNTIAKSWERGEVMREGETSVVKVSAKECRRAIRGTPEEYEHSDPQLRQESRLWWDCL